MLFATYDDLAASFPPAVDGAAADDDGLSPLEAQRYLTIRLGDQLSYYRRKVGELDRRRSVLQALTVAAGGVGAILAVAGLEIWIGLTTAISGAAWRTWAICKSTTRSCPRTSRPPGSPV